MDPATGDTSFRVWFGDFIGVRMIDMKTKREQSEKRCHNFKSRHLVIASFALPTDQEFLHQAQHWKKVKSGYCMHRSSLFWCSLWLWLPLICLCGGNDVGGDSCVLPEQCPHGMLLNAISFQSKRSCLHSLLYLLSKLTIISQMYWLKIGSMVRKY